MAIRLEAIATRLEPSLLGWRPSLFGWRPSLIGWSLETFLFRNFSSFSGGAAREPLVLQVNALSRRHPANDFAPLEAVPGEGRSSAVWPLERKVETRKERSAVKSEDRRNRNDIKNEQHVFR